MVALGHRAATAVLLLSVSALGLGAPPVPPAPPPQPSASEPAAVRAPSVPLDSKSALDIADPEGWGLVPSFADEFDGRRLDPRRWSAGQPGDTLEQRTMANNGENQLYADPSYLGLGIEPVVVRRGMATLVAERLNPRALASVRADLARHPAPLRNGVLRKLGYSSGRITTLGRFAQTYGYFEIRMRFSTGRGLWPAFWLLPADGSWPPEIDVMEVLGHEPTRVHQTMHSKANAVQRNENFMAPTPDGFHRYGVLWTPDRIEFYTDGLHTGSARTPGDAHKPMYMIANLAVGGYWPGSPDTATRFPAFMDIDYIRAWRFPAQTERTGQPPRR